VVEEQPLFSLLGARLPYCPPFVISLVRHNISRAIAGRRGLLEVGVRTSITVPYRIFFSKLIELVGVE